MFSPAITLIISSSVNALYLLARFYWLKKMITEQSFRLNFKPQNDQKLNKKGNSYVLNF